MAGAGSGALQYLCIRSNGRLHIFNGLLVSFISVTNKACIVRVTLSEVLEGSVPVGGWMHAGSGKSRIRLSSSIIFTYVVGFAENAVVMTVCMSFANCQVHT